MLSNIITILNLCIKYRLESLILIAIVFIVLFGIYCKITGKKGTWNVDYFHPKQIIIHSSFSFFRFFTLQLRLQLLHIDFIL